MFDIIYHHLLNYTIVIFVCKVNIFNLLKWHITLIVNKKILIFFAV